MPSSNWVALTRLCMRNRELRLILHSWKRTICAPILVFIIHIHISIRMANNKDPFMLWNP
uniref:Uncharacterized protein n=1 Tax=Arundo donax TaxID=35708 RepID=A0A0A9BTY6_ARUDO